VVLGAPKVERLGLRRKAGCSSADSHWRGQRFPAPYASAELQDLAQDCTETADRANKVERQVGKSAIDKHRRDFIAYTLPPHRFVVRLGGAIGKPSTTTSYINAMTKEVSDDEEA
jgi:hypothetical protein